MGTLIGSIGFFRSYVSDVISDAGGKHRKKLIRVCAAMPLLVIFFSQIFHRTTYPTRPPLIITAGEMTQAYTDNEASAEEKFKGNIVKINGIVQKLSIESGRLAVVLDGANAHTSIVAFLAEQEVGKAGLIHKSAPVTLFCDGEKFVSGNVTLRGCFIVS